MTGHFKQKNQKLYGGKCIGILKGPNEGKQSSVRDEGHGEKMSNGDGMYKMSFGVKKGGGEISYHVSQKKQFEKMKSVALVQFKYSKLPIILAEVTKKKRH